MPNRRFRAPAADGSILADPPREQVAELVERNRCGLERATVRIDGLPLREFRLLARQETLRATRDYLSEVGQPPPAALRGLDAEAPLFLAGHQPELSHPGVWVKNFALAGAAQQVGGVALNLVADTDTLKSTALRVPVLHDHDPTSVRLEAIPFDRFDAEEPYERRGVHDVECFRSFAERAASRWQDWGYEPLLPRVWPEVVSRPGLIGERFAAVRRQWERRWGCTNLELPVSRLARTQAFARFVSHLLADLPRFREVYNRAVQRYRAAHGIDNPRHPVPDLMPDEAPFWGPAGLDHRRARLQVPVPSGSLDVRPRALTLTLFARLGLGDFFIHGIGGGKYDEVTDQIIRDYFESEPPAYQVLSATLRLPLPRFPADSAEVARLVRQERDLYWNPQRHLTEADLARPEVGEPLRRHAALAASEPPDRAGRRQRYRQLREIGDQLRPLVEPQLAEIRGRLARAEREAAANQVLRRRDFAWVFYPEETLRPFLQRFSDASPMRR